MDTNACFSQDLTGFTGWLFRLLILKIPFILSKMNPKRKLGFEKNPFFSSLVVKKDADFDNLSCVSPRIR